MARVSNSSRFSGNASPLHCAIRAKKPSKYLTSARLSHTIVVCGTQERPCDWRHIGAFYAFAPGKVWPGWLAGTNPIAFFKLSPVFYGICSPS